MGSLLYYLGIVIGLIGGIWLLVVAFKESILWGLGCLFLPIVSLVFAIMFWPKAGKPFLIGVAGGIIAYIGAGMMISSM